MAIKSRSTCATGCDKAVDWIGNTSRTCELKPRGVRLGWMRLADFAHGYIINIEGIGVMFKLLERLRHREEEQKSTALGNVRDVVEAVADEKSYDELEALRILQVADMSIDDLEAAVELLKRARQWRQQIDDAEQAELDGSAAQARMTEICDEIKRVTEPLYAEMRAQREIVKRAETVGMAAMSARDSLRHTADKRHPELAEQESQLQAELPAAVDDQRRLSEYELALRQGNERIESLLSGDDLKKADRAELQGQLAERKKRHADAALRLSETTRVVDDLRRKIETIRELKLEP